MDGSVAMGDSELIAWLEEIELDQTSIQRVCNQASHFNIGRPIKCPKLHRLFPCSQFIAEKLTLRDVQDNMTRDDIVDLKLK